MKSTEGNGKKEEKRMIWVKGRRNSAEGLSTRKGERGEKEGRKDFNYD